MYTVYLIFVITLILSFITGSIILIVSKKENNNNTKKITDTLVNTNIDIELDKDNLINNNIEYDYNTPYIISNIELDENIS